MMSLAVQITLIIGILQAVAVVPQQFPQIFPRRAVVEGLMSNVRQQLLASGKPQVFTSPGPGFFISGQITEGGVIFDDERLGSSVNPNQIADRTSTQQFQLEWSPITNGCIIAQTDKAFQGIVSLEVCKSQCQLEIQNGCRSIEFNSKGSICILSRATRSSPTSNYIQPCPDDRVWIFSELIAATPQSSLQNDIRPQASRPDNTHQTSKPDLFGQVGGSQRQQNDDSPATSVVNTIRPVATNPNQQVTHTNQQSGSPSSQNGRPQTQQNGANQANEAAPTVPQHFITPTHKPLTHNVNQAQVAGTGSPISAQSGATSGSGQQKPSSCIRIPSPGECRGAFPRFFYNSTMDQCDCFLYGGCGDEALESSWLTLTECTDTCSPRNKQGGPRCRLLPKQDIQTFTQPSTLIQNFDSSNISDDQLIAGLLNQSNQKPNQQNNRFKTTIQG